ncbi:MAG TPA: ATP-binding protein [Nitrospirota bacterium]|nr:ATP-binding protein [Nitrospirota bacterium]
MTEDRAKTTTETGQAAEVVSLVVPSHPKYLYVIRSAIYPLVMEAGFPKRDAQRVVLAIDEACSNVIKYAYEGDHTKSYSVDITIGQGRLVVELKDFGKKPDVSKISPRKLDDVRPGGLGTHFIASVFDSVKYDTSREGCTVLTLVKEKP